MSKIKSFQLLFIAFFSLAIFACGGSEQSSNPTSSSTVVTNDNVEQVEAQAEELKNVEADIEAKIEDLDAALNALDF